MKPLFCRIGIHLWYYFDDGKKSLRRCYECGKKQRAVGSISQGDGWCNEIIPDDAKDINELKKENRMLKNDITILKNTLKEVV